MGFTEILHQQRGIERRPPRSCCSLGEFLIETFKRLQWSSSDVRELHLRLTHTREALRRQLAAVIECMK